VTKHYIDCQPITTSSFVQDWD